MTSNHEFYTHGHDPVIVGSHAQRTAADSAAFLLPYLHDGLRVLDFGCGPGSITADLAGHVAPTGTVIGIDSSAAAIATGRRDAAAFGVEYVEASVYDIPLPDAAVDVAYGHQVLQHLGEPIAALQEVNRVLKPGGLLAVRDADFGSMIHHPPYPELDRWLRLYSDIAGANGGEPDAGRHLLEWTTQAGFVDPVATTSTWTYAEAGARASWANLWSERIKLPRFADRAIELELCGADDIAAIAAAWTRWGQEPMGWFAFIHGEVIGTRAD